MAHHHHQLTAHSQLLSTGQIPFVHPPESLLPAASSSRYQDNRTNHDAFLRTAGISAGDGCCLICLQTLFPGRIRCDDGRKPVEVFSRTCELLQIPIEEIQHEWNIVESKSVPFCSACTEILQGLITLHEQIVAIQTRINTGLDNVRRIIQETSSSVPSSDMRVNNFRSKAMRCGNTTVYPKRVTRFLDVKSRGNTNYVTDQRPLINTPIITNNAVIHHNASMLHQQRTVPIPSSQPMTNAQFAYLDSSGSQNSTTFSIPNASFNNQPEYENDTHFPQASSPCQVQDTNQSFSSDGSQFDNSDINHESDDDSQHEDKKMSQRVSKKSAVFSKRLKVTRNSGASTKRSKVVAATVGSKRQSNEHFSAVITDEQGKMTFEGIVITPSETGYMCGQCGAKCGKSQDATSMRKIKIHIKGYHLGAYKCDLCNKNFTSNDILSQHITRVHEESEVPCDICLKPITPRQMNNHKFTHMNADEKAKCIDAGFKPHYKQLQRRFECTVCKKMFKKRPILRLHEATHFLDPGLRKDFKCHLCDRAYTSPQTLRKHIMAHHEQVENVRKKMCNICGKTMPAQALKRHLKTHIAREDLPNVCRICGARFRILKSLQKHEAAHDPKDTPENYDVGCDVCGKMFKTLKSLKYHRKKVHPNHWKLAVPTHLLNEVSIDKPDENGYLEDLNNEGLQHVDGVLYSYQLYQVEQLKEPSKGYRCTTCVKEFYGEGDAVEEKVKTHIRSEHIGNFRCNICTKRMKNMEEIRAHKLKEHLNKNGLDCEICKKPAIQVKGYKNHFWLHKNPYDAADAVNAGETLPHHYQFINKHEDLLMESGVKLSFKCVLCDAAFERVEHLYHHRTEVHPDALKVRIKRKPERKQYSYIRRKPKESFSGDCPDCGKTFATKKSLQRHLKNVHKKLNKDQHQTVVEKRERKQINSSIKVSRKEIRSSSENETGDDASDHDEVDNLHEHSSQSDPNVKVLTSVRTRSSSRLRDRSKIRLADKHQSAAAAANDENDRCELKVECMSAKEDDDDLPLIPDDEIKQSPQSSDADEYDSDY